MLAGILIPLFADFLDTVVPIILLILYGIGQLLSGREEAKKKAPRARKPRAPRKPDGALGGGDPPQNQADSLRREVEEFLQRAQGQPKEQEVPVGRPLRAPQLEPESQRSKRSASPQTKQRTSQSVDIEEVVPSSVPLLTPVVTSSDLRHEGVAEHVSKHIKPQELAEHAEHLGDEISSIEQRLESHLHQTFDHQLGALRHQEDNADVRADQPDIAAEIARMLSEPSGMRQLIVAQEILRRPDRW